MSKLIKFTIILALMATSYSARAAILYSRVSGGAFATPGTWSTDPAGSTTYGTALGASDSFTIRSTHTVNLNANQAVTNLTIVNGGILISQAAQARVLTVSGTWTNNGTFTSNVGIVTFATGTPSIAAGTGLENFTTINIASGSVLSIANGAAVTVSANFAFIAPSVNNSVTLIGTSSLNVTGTSTMNSPSNGFSSTLAIGTGTFTSTGLFLMSGTSASRMNVVTIGTTGTANFGAINNASIGGSVITVTGGGTINVSGATTGTPTLTPGSGTVNFTSGSAQAIWNETYYNLGFSGAGSKTIATGVTIGVTGDWNVNSATTMTTTAGANVTGDITGTGAITMGSGIIALEGDWTNSGTFTQGTGTVNYDGAGAQFVRGMTYNNLQTTIGSTKTLAGNATVNNVLTVSTPATFNVGAFTVTLPLAGNPLVSTGTLTGTGTVLFSGGTGQNVPGTTYPNLQFSGAGAKTIATGTTINVAGDWIVGAATTMTTTAGANITGDITGAGAITMGSGIIAIEGDWTNSGTFTLGTGTVNYDGSGAQSVRGMTYYNLQVTIGNTKTLAGNATVNNVLTVSTPATFDVGAFTVTLPLAGSPLVSTGTLTGTGTVLFSGGTGQTVAGTTYPNLQFSGAGAKTIATGTTINVAGNWIVGTATTMTTTGSANVAGSISGSGAITMGSGTILLEGAWTNNGTFTRGTGTVNFDGAGTQTIPALAYNNLQATVGGTKTLAGNTTVNNILTVSTPATLDLGAFTITLPLTGVPLVNTGTLAGTGKVLYSGTGAQTVAGTTYYDLEFSGAGTKTISTGTTVTATNNWIVGSPTTMTTTAGATIAGNISGAGSITMGSGTISFAGAWTNNGTFTKGTGTINYNGTTQSIAALAYHNLQTSNAGTKTLGGNTSASGAVTIGASSELNLSNRTLTLSGPTNPLVIDPAGTFTASTSTVIYSTGAQNIALANYYNLDCPAGAKTYPAGTIGIAGTFNPTGSTQTVDNANIVNFNGVNPTQAITGGFPFKKMILSGSGQKIISNTVGVTEVEIQNGPTMDITTGQLDIN